MATAEFELGIKRKKQPKRNCDKKQFVALMYERGTFFVGSKKEVLDFIAKIDHCEVEDGIDIFELGERKQLVYHF